MKTLFTLKSAFNQSILNSLVSMLVLMPAVYPHAVALASQTSSETALIFEIKDPSVLFKNNSSDENQKTLSFDEIVSNDPLTIRLHDYLVAHKSPLAPYASEMVKQPQWQRALAISWVESNFCIHRVDNNCSGIGVAPGHPSWRKYPTVLEWFKDMSKLMETPRYKEKYTSFEKMKGIYVYPGSPSWVNGSKQKYGELMSLTSQALEDSVALANKSTQIASLHTFPTLALAD
jgi:hypothetical protein